ncbi:MAG: TolC family protein [Bacteroidia bacterium]
MKKSLTALLLFLSVITRAQNSDSTYRFSIKQAIDFSFEHQTDVVNAAIDVDVARTQVNEITGMGLPQLNASFDLKDYVEIPTSLIPAEFFGGAPGSYAAIKFGTQYNATAGISASQLIFEPSYIVGVQAARAFKELSMKNLERTKIETAIAVTKAYYSLLVMRDRKKVVDANEVRLKKLLDDVKALYANGFVEKIDVDRIQVTYNNMVSEQDNFNRLLDLTLSNLKFQIGIPQSSKLELTDTLNTDEIRNYITPADPADPSRRIEYSLLKAQERIQQYNVKRYKGQYLPSLVAYGALNTTAQRTEFDIFGKGRWYPTGIIGATLSLNLFDGLQKDYRIRREKLNLRKIGYQLENLENGIKLEVESNRSQLITALNTMKIQEENLSLADNVVKTTRIKYEQGIGSNTELIDAETSLKEAQFNYYNALYNALIAKISLDKSLGNFKY